MPDNPRGCSSGLSQIGWAEDTLGIIECFVCGGTLDVTALSVHGRGANLNWTIAPVGVVNYIPSTMRFPG